MAKEVYISPPLIRNNEYVAGFYTTKDNSNTQNITSTELLRKLTIVSSNLWTRDWLALQDAKFNNVIHEPIWNAQVKMVHQHLADALLLPFSNLKDMSYQFLGKTYHPIPNYLLRMPESRHVIISKKHPLGEQAYTALFKGMKILRDKGTIKRAFQESGLINQQVEKWQQVN